MKAKILYIFLSLLLLFCFGNVTSVHAVVSMSPVQGIVDSTVTVNGLTSSQTYIIQWDSSNYSSGTVPSSGTVTFTVPETTGGSHTVQIQNPAGTLVLTQSFEVLPSITISPTSGEVGTTITVNGTGFDDGETDIYITYDDTNMETDITADSDGSWSETFAAPASCTGDHDIDAAGDTTTLSSIEDKKFTVKPAISISPQSGGVGTQITVTGKGFAASEASISVTYDSTTVISAITADSKGSWSSKLAVPSSSSGSHTIDASGSTTDADDITDISFTVSPSVNIDVQSGYVGETINVTGSGFSQNETGIYVTYDGSPLGDSTIANSNGQWSLSRTIPASVNGSHIIDAHGVTTPATSVTDKTINIAAQIILSPTNGNVGDTINISGTGFSKTQTVSVTYAGTPALTGVSTDSSGNFAGSFKAPEGQSGQIQVVATDAASATASSVFSMETTSPDTPEIKSPADGNRVGFVGDTKVNFDWTDVSDPSGVAYDFQVSSSEDFNTRIIEKSGLTASEYKSTDSEALPRGEYYWRVRAIDGANNASDWTKPTRFKAALMTTTTLIIIIVVVVVLLIGLRVFMMRRRR